MTISRSRSILFQKFPSYLIAIARLFALLYLFDNTMVAAMPPQTCRERSRACRLITGYFLLIIASIIVIPTSIYMVDYLKGGDWGTPVRIFFEPNKANNLCSLCLALCLAI